MELRELERRRKTVKRREKTIIQKKRVLLKREKLVRVKLRMLRKKSKRKLLRNPKSIKKESGTLTMNKFMRISTKRGNPLNCYWTVA